MDRCPNCGFTADLSPREKRALENEIDRLKTGIARLRRIIDRYMLENNELRDRIVQALEEIRRKKNDEGDVGS